MNRTKSYYTYKNIKETKLKVEAPNDNLPKSKNGNIHDTAIRNVLMHKSEAVILINNTYKYKKKIKEEDIELYNNRFVTNNFTNKESDVIYKMKDKDVFFLIEHQSTIDYNMPRRIAEYELEIINQYIQNSKINNKKYRTPLVKAIVVYTGKRKWDVAKTIEESQVKLEEDDNKFGKYEVIEVNNISENEKLKSKGALLKIAMFDMAENREELERLHIEVSKEKLTKEEKTIIKEYISKVTGDLLDSDKKFEILEKYKEEGGENMLVETLRREIKKEKAEARRTGRMEGRIEGEKIGKQQGLQNGKIIGLKTAAKEMLKQKIDMEIIMQCTKLSEEEIKKL